jgi:hypothetical protein
LALPAAVVALGMADAPSALADGICTASSASQFTTVCVPQANAAGAGFTIIQIPMGTVLTGLTGPITLTGHTEITGPPTASVPLNATTGDSQINGTGDPTLTTQDLFKLSSGANVIFKSFDLDLCGATTVACVEVSQNAHAEFDNMAIEGANGLPVIVDSGTPGSAGPPIVNGIPGGMAIFNETSIIDGSGNGPEIQGGSAIPTNEGGGSTAGDASFNNATISNNGIAGIDNQANSIVNLNNTVIDFSNQTAVGAHDCANTVQSAGSSQADDASCGTGVTTETAAGINLGFSNFNGGGTETQVPADPNGTISGSTSGTSTLTNAGNPLTCAVSDQRFDLKTPGSCTIGAYQTTGVPDPETTGPTCKVTALNEASPASEQVTITDAMSGIGPDAITNATISSTFTGGAGTVAWPGVPVAPATAPPGTSTLFDETSPGQSPALDYPNNTLLPASGAGFVVTATKLAADTTVNDTHWTFDATNWLGQTTLCH